MSEDTLFHKIIRRELPADVVYEDDDCIVIRDINPQAPVHLLLIPKATLPKLSDAEPAHAEMLGRLMVKAGEVARTAGIGDAFRLVVNNGAGACQTVFQLHLHILGGRSLSWPPG